MKPATEDKLLSLGCWTVLLSTIFLGYLAVTTNSTYFLLALFFLPAWIQVLRIRKKIGKKIERQALQEIVRGAGDPIPAFRLVRGSHYSYPTFALVFQSKSDYDRAKTAGCIKACKEFIHSRYAHVGGKQNPFDVERAFTCTWDENILPKSPDAS